MYSIPVHLLPEGALCTGKTQKLSPLYKVAATLLRVYSVPLIWGCVKQKWPHSISWGRRERVVTAIWETFQERQKTEYFFCQPNLLNRNKTSCLKECLQYGKYINYKIFHSEIKIFTINWLTIIFHLKYYSDLGCFSVWKGCNSSYNCIPSGMILSFGVVYSVKQL